MKTKTEICGIVCQHGSTVEAYGRTWDAGNGKVREIVEFDSHDEAEERAERLRKSFPDTTYTVCPMTQIHAVLAESRAAACHRIEAQTTK